MSRFLEWLPDVQEDVGWIREQVLKVLQRVVRQASKSVFQHVSARYVWLPSYIQVFHIQVYTAHPFQHGWDVTSRVFTIVATGGQ